MAFLCEFCVSVVLLISVCSSTARTFAEGLGVPPLTILKFYIKGYLIFMLSFLFL